MISRSDQNAIEISEMTKIAIDNILPNTRPDRRMPNTPTNDDDSGDSSDNNSSDSDSSTSTLAPPVTKRARETKEKTHPYGLFAPGTSPC